jgi:hypothetical protein
LTIESESPLNQVDATGRLDTVAHLTGLQRERRILKFFLHLAFPKPAAA